jgi:hypothetical protein
VGLVHPPLAPVEPATAPLAVPLVAALVTDVTDVADVAAAPPSLLPSRPPPAPVGVQPVPMTCAQPPAIIAPTTTGTSGLQRGCTGGEMSATRPRSRTPAIASLLRRSRSVLYVIGVSSYRDERTALQERVEVLEEDLRDARSKAEHADALGRDVADKQKEIDGLRAKLAKYQAPPRPAAKVATAAILALVLLCAAGGAVAFLALKPAPSPPSAAPAPVVAVGDELPEACEAYFRQIEVCVDKHPEMAALRENAPQQRAAFKTGLASPAASAAVISACSQSLKALQDSCK